MSANLEILRDYFEAGNAEGDSSFLADAFITFAEYWNVVKVPRGGPRIIVGSKGSGKSAILRHFKYQMEQLDVPVILVRPKDIDLSQSNDNSLGALTRECEASILRAIAGQIGSGFSGLVLGRDEETLLKEARKSGEIDIDKIGGLSRVLSQIGKPLSGIDFTQIVEKDIHEGNSQRTQTAIESYLRRSGKSFFVLIDDTDQIASLNEKGHLNRVWSFLLAARAIMEECANIKFIVTLRNEVWRRLNRDNSSQRDQVDHFRSFVTNISPQENEIKRIINRRLELAIKVIEPGKSYVDPYSVFFSNSRVQVPTTEETFRYWSDFIVKSSRKRPRDAIQLIFYLIVKAIEMKSSKIDSVHARDVLPVYSKERVDDLQREFEQECPSLKSIIRNFSKADYDAGTYTLEAQKAYEFIEKLPSRFSVELYGKTLKPGNRDNVLLLWRFLHEIGFLNARVNDSSQRKDFRHITADDDPELVSHDRWNEMQAMLWEIHPAYRHFLIDESEKNKELARGLPAKTSRRKQN